MISKLQDNLPLLRRSSSGLRTLLTGLVAAALCTGFACQNTNGAATNDDTDSPTAQTEEPQKPADDDGGEAKDGSNPNDSEKAPAGGGDAQVASDVYPDLPIGLLKQSQRQAVKRIFEAQLCPCPGAAESMHACLQKKESQCPLAKQAALEAMRKLNEGLGERDVLDHLGQYIEAAYKKYSFDLEGIPHKGDPDAPVKIVEFADFQCPYCNLARKSVEAVREKYGDKVVVYFMQFPLSTHQHATSAALASLAAKKQGKFWEMYTLLFNNQRSLSDQKILQLARELGLNMEKFKTDWRSSELAEEVTAQKRQGEEAQVKATPSFFINGRRHLGEKTPEGLKRAVANALESN